MHKIALDDEKIALAHTIFNMIWKLAELIRSEFLKRMPVSETVSYTHLTLPTTERV